MLKTDQLTLGGITDSLMPKISTPVLSTYLPKPAVLAPQSGWLDKLLNTAEKVGASYSTIRNAVQQPGTSYSGGVTRQQPPPPPTPEGPNYLKIAAIGVGVCIAGYVGYRIVKEKKG